MKQYANHLLANVPKWPPLLHSKTYRLFSPLFIVTRSPCDLTWLRTVNGDCEQGGRLPPKRVDCCLGLNTQHPIHIGVRLFLP